MVKITIDAGHYGKYNQSPANKKYYESQMTWKLHLLQKKYLEEYGAKVILTRSDQTADLGTTARGECAKGSDLFISDHSNAIDNKVNDSVDYVAVYHLVNDDTTKCDDVSKAIANKIAPVIAEVMGTSQGHRVLTRKIDSDRNKDGIMNDNYYGVLHGARTVGVPGLILEHSFHTNTKMTNWLMDDNNLDKLARAEAQVIAEHFGLSKVKETVIKKNDVVSVCECATYYGETKKVPAWVRKKNWIVKSVSGDRAVIDESQDGKNAICSAVNVKFLTVVSTEAKPSEPVKKEIKVGSTVRVKKGAKTFQGGNLASFVYDRDHQVKEINVDRVVITYNGIVVAAVRKSDLTVVN